MNASELEDLVSKECVLIESGRGSIVRLKAVRDDSERLWADLEYTHPTRFSMNRIRLNDEPPIESWYDEQADLGKIFTIFQPKINVHRTPQAYVHFSSPYGGTRLLFLDEYVEKVRRKDGDDWEWDSLMKKASLTHTSSNDADADELAMQGHIQRHHLSLGKVHVTEVSEPASLQPSIHSWYQRAWRRFMHLLTG